MRNTLKTLILTVLALLTLNLASLAEPQPTPPAAEEPVNAVVETLELRETPTQPLILADDNEKKEVQSEARPRPRGESRTIREQSSQRAEKPLLEVHGF